MGKRKLKKPPALIKPEKPTIPVAERQVYMLFQIYKTFRLLVWGLAGLWVLLLAAFVVARWL